MKTLSMTVAAITLFVGTALASGNEDKKSTRIGVVPVQNETFNLIYGGESETRVKIEILDMDGHLLHSDRVFSKGGFMKPYNFNNVDKGTYTIRLTDKFGEITQEIQVGAFSPCTN